MTPRELGREFEAARLRSVDEYRRDVTLAWNVSRVFFKTKAKKQMPELRALLSEMGEGEGGGQSARELLATVEMLSHMTGFPMRRKGEAKQ